MGQRDEQKAATKARVVAAAYGLFREHGFEAVGMREIANAAMVSTGAIFANFPSKDALFEAAIGEPAPDVRGFLTRLIEIEAGIKASEASDALYELAEFAKVLRVCLYGEKPHAPGS